MATKVNVNGKLVTRPGVYTLVTSGIQNAPIALGYGNVCIIDDGIGAGWGGGQGKQSYVFNTPQDLQSFVKGGPIWDLASPLFKPVPGKPNILGASSVTLIHARDTTPATITIPCTNGTMTLTTLDQGLNANGIITNSDLRQGYAVKLIVSPRTAGKYILQLWHGTYSGLDALNNAPYAGTLVANAAPVLITQSPEVSDLVALLAWVQSDPNMIAGVTAVNGALTSGGAIVAGDASVNYILATGATETYNASALAAAELKANSADINFVLSMQYGAANIRHANTLDILSNVVLGQKYEKFLIVAGGATAAELDTVSIPAAVLYNSDKVIIVHGDGLNTVRNGSKVRSQLWKAANVAGRLAGLPPQTPLTLKSIGIDSESATSTIDEAGQERALAAGVVVTYNDTELGYEVILQGVNTLQNNTYLVNDDGSSFSIAVKRIEAQLNKEAAIYLKRKFFGNDNVGPNRNTVTEADLAAAMEGFLQAKTASSLTDNYIIKFRNISATVSSDTYSIRYEFIPNFEVNKFIVTGVIFDK